MGRRRGHSNLQLHPGARAALLELLSELARREISVGEFRRRWRAPCEAEGPCVEALEPVIMAALAARERAAQVVTFGTGVGELELSLSESLNREVDGVLQQILVVVASAKPPPDLEPASPSTGGGKEVV